jgi:hypothetical protein
VTGLAYRRLSASRPPVREQLELGPDGTLEVWRSNGPLVGRFAGGPGDGERLVAALAAARAAPRPGGAAAPAPAVFEVLEAGDEPIGLGPGGDPGGAWGDLLAACRDVVDHPGLPVAAIGLVVEAPGRLRLAHQGTEALRVGLGAVIAETVVFRDGAQAGLAQARVVDGAVDAGPGWSHTIELEPLDAAGASVVASVSFSASDAGVWVPVRCEVTATG